MNKAELKILETKLILEIKSTQEKINEYSELCKPIAPENAIGRVSRMDAINNKSVVEAALNMAINKMNQLKSMQNKINTADFGICKKCKKIIAFQRLILQPHSKFCVLCAE